MHIDADLAEIGRNYQTELGVVADAKLALGALAAAAKGRAAPRPRTACARHRRPPARSTWRNFSGQYASDQYPLRPERILAELRKAAARRTPSSSPTWAGTRTASASSIPFSVPYTFITPSGLATMGFGAGGGARRQDGPARSRGASRWSATAASAPPIRPWSRRRWKPICPVIWVVMDNKAFGTIAGLEKQNYDWSFGCTFECDGKPYRVGLRRDGARLRRRRRHDRDRPTSLAPALQAALASNRPTRHPGADGERADADAGALEHPRHLPQGRVAPGRTARPAGPTVTRVAASGPRRSVGTSMTAPHLTPAPRTSAAPGSALRFPPVAWP